MEDEREGSGRASDVSLTVLEDNGSATMPGPVIPREQRNIYSGGKILHHENRFRQWLTYELEKDRTGSSDKIRNMSPIMAEMHFNTNACDHDCFGNLASGCGGNWLETNRQWGKDEGLQFIDQLEEAGVKSMPISGGGEPMLHPYFSEFVERASKFLDVGLITHGGRIRSLDIAKFIVQNTKWVRVSLGGAKTETFMERHRIKREEVEKCWRGLDYLVQAKRELLSLDPDQDLSLINVGFLTNEKVAHETYEMAERSRKAGADSFSVRPDHYSTNDSTALIEEARRHIQNERFSIFFPPMKFQKMEEQVRKENPLVTIPYKDHFSTMAGGDCHGYVDCFNVNRPWADYGDFGEDGFNEVWGSKRRVDAIERHLRKPETHYRSHFDATSAALAGFREQYIAEGSESKRADLVESWISERDENVKHVNFINN